MRRMLLLFMLILMPTVMAEIDDSIFDVLDMDFFDGDWSIVSGHGTPVKTVQANGNIRGWIDIVGFENMCNIGGKNYVDGDPDDLAIVKYGAWDTIDGWNSNVDHFKKTRSVTCDGENVTAKLHLDLLWHTSRLRCSCSPEGGCHCWISKTYHRETANFHVSEPCPNMLTPIENVTAKITFYNHSRSPVAFIDVEPPEYVIKTIFTYNNSSITRHDLVGWVLSTTEGTEYVGFSSNSTVWQIDKNQSMITRRGNSVVIRDRHFNLSKLNISMDTPYSRHYIGNLTMTMVEPAKPKVGVLAKILMVLSVSVIGIIMIVGVVRRSF